MCVWGGGGATGMVIQCGVDDVGEGATGMVIQCGVDDVGRGQWAW